MRRDYIEVIIRKKEIILKENRSKDWLQKPIQGKTIQSYGIRELYPTQQLHNMGH